MMYTQGCFMRHIFEPPDVEVNGHALPAAPPSLRGSRRRHRRCEEAKGRRSNPVFPCGSGLLRLRLAMTVTCGSGLLRLRLAMTVGVRLAMTVGVRLAMTVGVRLAMTVGGGPPYSTSSTASGAPPKAFWASVAAMN